MSDEFLARLRAAATETPPVHVDRGSVLRAGRRRRVERVAGGVGMTGLLLAGTVTAYASLGPAEPQTPAGPSVSTSRSPQATQAPSPDATSPSPEATDVPFDKPYEVVVVAGEAEVDAAAGRVRLPFGDVFLTADDYDVIAAAQDAFLDPCFEDAGYGEYYSPGEGLMRVDSPARHAREAEPYGPWRSSDVRDHGYAAALTMWGPPPDEESSGLPFTEEMAAASRGCYRAMIEAGLEYEAETAAAGAPLGLPSLFETPEGATIIAEWEQCLGDNDVAPRGDDMSVLIPAEVWNASLDEQVRIGLVDAQCKDDVDLVQRLADVEAAYQLAYLERGRAWVDEYTALQQRTLRAAEAYLEQAAAGGASD